MPADEREAGASAGVLPAKKRGSLAAIGRLRTFQALQHRDYRLLWLGQCGYSLATWGETIARGWLIYDMTGSAKALGLASMLRSVPMLILGLLAGVIADRFDKRKILMVCQTATMLNLLLLSILILTHNLQVWHIMVTNFFMGCSLAFIMPARQSLIPFLVGKENVSNAVALSSAAMNINRIVGPSLAGALIQPIGTGGVYLSITAIYLSIVTTTFLIRVPPDAKKGARHRSMGSNLKEGLRYCAGNRDILTILVLTIVPIIFGMPYMVLMPIFAKDIFHMGPSGYGFLISMAGIGGFSGAMAVASLGDFRRKGYLMLVGVFAFGGALVVFSQAPWLALAVPAVMLASGMNTAYMTTSNGLLLKITPSEIYGRVMSMRELDVGLQPLGQAMAGFMADGVGAPMTLTLMGGVCMALAATTALTTPRVRRLG